MKTHETIKKALAHCRLKGICDSRCPYYHEGCGDALRTDALACIEQLEEQIALMKIQMQGDCGTCKHRHDRREFDDDQMKCKMSKACYECLSSNGRSQWEYEGLPEVARKENK